MHNLLSSRKTKLLTCLVLMILALGIRLNFLQNSAVNHPLRNDAGAYFNAAFNISHWGIYSTTTPNLSTAPKPDAARSPGFPLILSGLIATSNDIASVVYKARIFHAFLGSLMVAMASWLIWSQINPILAIFSGLLLAINPHLIVMEGYILTETLYAFELLFGILLAQLAFNRKSRTLALLAGAIFGYAALTRPSALLIPVFICFFIFISDWRKQRTTRHSIIWPLLLAWFFIVAVFVVRNVVSIGTSTAGASAGWGSFIQGTYLNMSYAPSGVKGYPYRFDPLYPRMIEDKSFAFKNLAKKISSKPFRYISWYLIGKTIEANYWDMSVEGYGDIYIYPLRYSPFETSSFFKGIRHISKSAHWFIVTIGLATALMLFYQILSKDPDREAPPLMVLCSLIALYHVMQGVVFYPAPRYTIPLKPEYLILTSYALMHITISTQRYLKNRTK